MQLIAFFNGIPAGTLDVYIRENTAEIDSLFVRPSFQKRELGVCYKSLL